MYTTFAFKSNELENQKNQIDVVVNLSNNKIVVNIMDFKNSMLSIGWWKNKFDVKNRRGEILEKKYFFIKFNNINKKWVKIL